MDPKVATNISNSSIAGGRILCNLHRVATALPSIVGPLRSSGPALRSWADFADGLRNRMCRARRGFSPDGRGTFVLAHSARFFWRGLGGVRFSEGGRGLPRSIRDQVCLRGGASRLRLDAYESSVAILKSRWRGCANQNLHNPTESLERNYPSDFRYRNRKRLWALKAAGAQTFDTSSTARSMAPTDF